jgi:hypothetical protein
MIQSSGTHFKLCTTLIVQIIVFNLVNACHVQARGYFCLFLKYLKGHIMEKHQSVFFVTPCKDTCE